MLLKAIIDNAADAVIAIDSKGIILIYNKIAEEIFGYSEQEALGVNVSLLMPSPYAEEHDAYIEAYIRTGVAHIINVKREVEAKRKDGSLVSIELSVSEAFNDEGRIFLALVRDITQRKETERKIKDQHEKLENSNRDLEQFAYVASHDLQEPLRKIIMFTGKLKEDLGDSLTEKADYYLGRVEDAAERMQVLLHSILEYSRVQTTGVAFAETDLKNIFEIILFDLDDYINRHKAKIIFEGDFAKVQADAVQLLQLFTNLISNAIKYRKEGVDPVVEVKARIEEGMTVVTISDNGIGFDQGYATKIFEQLQRLHGRNSAYEGTGMGLAICRKIVERHNGSIEAFSQPGLGSSFVVKLPLARA